MNTIYHWQPEFCKKTGYKQNQKFERDRLYDIVDHILEHAGLNVMIERVDDGKHTIVHIDGKYRFKQR